MLLNSLILWLDFSVQHQDRSSIFNLVWQTIVQVIKHVPNNHQITLGTIILPHLYRLLEFAKHTPPTQPMLNFLILTLGEIKSVESEILEFARQFL